MNITRRDFLKYLGIGTAAVALGAKLGIADDIDLPWLPDGVEDAPEDEAEDIFFGDEDNLLSNPFDEYEAQMAMVARDWLDQWMMTIYDSALS